MRRSAWPLLFALIAIAPAGAMGADGPVMDLARAYRLALDNDPSIRAARAAAQARQERVPQARAQFFPVVSASVTQFRNDLDRTEPGLLGFPVTSDSRYTSGARTLSLRQPLYRPFNDADYRQAIAQVEQATAALEQEVQKLAVRVATAYLQALAAEDQLSLVLAQKTAFTTQLDSARRRLAGGAGTRTDIDEAQARLDMALAQELEARQDIAFTRQQLQALVGVAVGELAPLDPGRLALVAPVPANVEAWTARAEQGSPEIRALQAQVEAARQEIDKARSGHLPTLDAVGQWSVSRSDSVTRIDSHYDHKAVGLQLNVPLLAGGYVDSRVRQALAELERAGESLEAGRRDLGLRVHKEFRAIGEGVLRVRALEQAVRSAETLLQSTRRSYEGGSRTQVDVLNAQEQRAAALRELAQARYTYLLSRIRLRALTGEADLAALMEANGWLRP